MVTVGRCPGASAALGQKRGLPGEIRRGSEPLCFWKVPGLQAAAGHLTPGRGGGCELLSERITKQTLLGLSSWWPLLEAEHIDNEKI